MKKIVLLVLLLSLLYPSTAQAQELPPQLWCYSVAVYDDEGWNDPDARQMLAAGFFRNPYDADGVEALYSPGCR